MDNKNNLAKTNNAVSQPAFSTFMEKVGSKLVANTLKDPKRAQQFTANIIAAVSNNPTLRECDQTSVVSGALQAEALHFPINNSLGYAYLVPFNDKQAKCKKAQFQIGYKGYIQLAIRSGQYRNINVTEVREGEVVEYDPLNGPVFKWECDYSKRKSLPVVGYVAQLELVNEFKQQVYFTYEEMLDHADTYSQAFNKDIYLRIQNGEVLQDMWKYSSFWYKNFDEMAKKTALRQLLSKWGIMSVEMQEAYIKDQSEIKEDGSYDYIDARVETPADAVEKVEQKQSEVEASKEPEDNFNFDDFGA